MKKVIIAFPIIVFTLCFGAILFAGSLLTDSVPEIVGNCPTDLVCENVTFSSESGAEIKGWVVSGEKGKGVITLMHGLRSNRTQLLERIRFLNRQGFGVFAFDFQGSGESKAEQLTFGYQESKDAHAALKYIRQKLPGEKIGVIGISMGGAAYLLQKEPEKADALILEMVYPTLQKAVENRLNLWLFNGADKFSFLLTKQLPLRLGVTTDDLRPLDKMSGVSCPTLFIVGENDRHTTLEESRQLFDAANQPKDIWIVPRAEHSDLHKNAPKEYETKVLEFFGKTLKGEN